jgi:glutamyl-tRNA synthetase
LHIGGARTALFNWLFARHHQGSFILRIEDTDRSRSTEESIEAIINGMNWLGLNWDEGPIRQTERMALYQAEVQKLLDQDKAYYCYCSADELKARREEALKTGQQPSYDGRCRNRVDKPSADVAPTVRFKAPLEGRTVVNDLIKGEIVFENAQLDDFIILRSDGTPTYNFVVVVDDATMKITHVIRGDDHLTNTPKQIQIYQALGYDPPQFAHLPMILGPDKTRLSKRHGAMSVMSYAEIGFLPEALVNYLARLGWSFGDQEVFSKDELIEKFTLDNAGKAAAVFNPEKLLWLNGYYLARKPTDELIQPATEALKKENIIPQDATIYRPWLVKAIDSFKERAQDLKTLALGIKLYLDDSIEFDPKAQAKFLNEKTLPMLTLARDELVNLETFDVKSLEKAFTSLMEKENIKLGKIAQPVRVAVTGSTASPGIFEMLELMGKQRVIDRLDRAIAIARG